MRKSTHKYHYWNVSSNKVREWNTTKAESERQQKVSINEIIDKRHWEWKTRDNETGEKQGQK